MSHDGGGGCEAAVLLSPATSEAPPSLLTTLWEGLHIEKCHHEYFSEEINPENVKDSKLRERVHVYLQSGSSPVLLHVAAPNSKLGLL